MAKYKILSYEEIISLESLLPSWRDFSRGKLGKSDVAIFASKLLSNLIKLESDLNKGQYRHGRYFHFRINDPKSRDIHKATVRDRIVHHALYRALYPHFASKFVYDSYSCQLKKGTHRALLRLQKLVIKGSQNNSRPIWALKGDIKKCFASIDHEILKNLLAKQIKDYKTLNLLVEIINSFPGNIGIGIPLGNLTSQLFVNVYLNELDQFVKHTLRERYYVRYADDFVILSNDARHLEEIVLKLDEFLHSSLKLSLHPDKVYIKSFASGVDFLGWVHFLKHRTLRRTTKWRMMKKIKENPIEKIINSYLGLLKYGNAHNLTLQIKNLK